MQFMTIQIEVSLSVDNKDWNGEFWVLLPCLRNFKWYNLQWRIQDVPNGRQQPQDGGANLSFGQIFPKNYMKMKEIGTRERCMSLVLPWIRQWFTFWFCHYFCFGKLIFFYLNLAIRDNKLTAKNISNNKYQWSICDIKYDCLMFWPTLFYDNLQVTISTSHNRLDNNICIFWSHVCDVKWLPARRPKINTGTSFDSSSS